MKGQGPCVPSEIFTIQFSLQNPGISRRELRYLSGDEVRKIPENHEHAGKNFRWRYNPTILETRNVFLCPNCLTRYIQT